MVPSPGATSVVAQAATAAAITSVSAPGSAVMNRRCEVVADVDDRRVESDQELDQAPGRQRPVRLDLWAAVVGVAEGLEPGGGKAATWQVTFHWAPGAMVKEVRRSWSLFCHGYRLCEPRGSLVRDEVAEQPPGRGVDRVHQALVSARVLRRRGEQPGEQVVGGHDQAGSRGVGCAVAAGEPLGERRVAQQHRVGWLPRMLRPMVWLIGTRLFATNAVRYRSWSSVRNRTGRPMTPNHSCRASSRSWLDGFGDLPGDRQRRAEQVPHGELRDQGQREPQVGGRRVGTGQVDHRAEGSGVSWS